MTLRGNLKRHWQSFLLFSPAALQGQGTNLELCYLRQEKHSLNRGSVGFRQPWCSLLLPGLHQAGSENLSRTSWWIWVFPVHARVWEFLVLSCSKVRAKKTQEMLFVQSHSEIYYPCLLKTHEMWALSYRMGRWARMVSTQGYLSPSSPVNSWHLSYLCS